MKRSPTSRPPAASLDASAYVQSREKGRRNLETRPRLQPPHTARNCVRDCLPSRLTMRTHAGLPKRHLAGSARVLTRPCPGLSPLFRGISRSLAGEGEGEGDSRHTSNTHGAPGPNHAISPSSRRTNAPRLPRFATAVFLFICVCVAATLLAGCASPAPEAPEPIDVNQLATATTISRRVTATLRHPRRHRIGKYHRFSVRSAGDHHRPRLARHLEECG